MDDVIRQLAYQVGKKLAQKNHKLVTAESCTGGWLSKSITDIEGSSDWFDRGFVTYSNQAKIDMLGVTAVSLEEHGAVSEAVVREMVAGALRYANAQLAVAITGIAGPSGGTPDKPVGSVWLAWQQADSDEAIIKLEHFAGNRQQIRAAAVKTALQGIINRYKQ